MQETDIPFDEKNSNKDLSLTDFSLSEEQQMYLRYWRAANYRGRGLAWSIQNRIPLLRTDLYELTHAHRARFNFLLLSEGLLEEG